MQQFVAYEIWRAVHEQYLGTEPTDIRKQFKVEPEQNVGDIVSILVKKVGGRRFLLHFDELNALNDLKPPVFSSATDIPEGELEKYYAFWTISMVVYKQKCSLIFSGRADRLNEIGKGKLGKDISPSSLYPLHLPPFSPSDIAEIISTDKYKNLVNVLTNNKKWSLEGSIVSKVAQAVKGTKKMVAAVNADATVLPNENEVAVIAQRLHELSDGIPRILVHILDELTGVSSTDDMIISSMNPANERTFLQYVLDKYPRTILGPLRSGSLESNADGNRLLRIILYHAIAGDNYTLKERFPECIESDPTIQEMAQMYNIFVTPADSDPSNRVRLILPRIFTYTEWLMQLAGGWGLFLFNPVYTPEVKGVVLERAVNLTCFARCRSSLVNALPFLANTALSDCSVADRSYVRFNQKITVNNHNRIVGNFLERTGVAIGVPLPQSKSVDLFLKVVFDYTSAPGLLLFQLKNQKKGSVRIATLIKEVELAETTVKLSRAKFPSLADNQPTCVFVPILINKGTKEVESLRGRLSQRVPRDKAFPVKAKGAKKDAEDLLASIPVGLQVYIPTEEELKN